MSPHAVAAQAVRAQFERRFSRVPRVFQAPGRINIIGEHTDYSGGLAMPAAIDRRCLVAAAPNDGRRLRVLALSYAAEGEADLDALTPQGGWMDYVAGVASVLIEDGVPLPGADLCIASDVPVGVGVSSSAALEVAVAHALLALAGRAADGVAIARWGQAAENRFVGMPCGIMDQYASANGVAGCALLLDCASVSARPVPLPPEAAFIIVDSLVRHAHVEGEYRRRREECERAAERLGVALLSQASPQAASGLTGAIGRRARHVASENDRVRRAAAALEAGDLPGLGALMTLSHASLRDDMEVSDPDVDRLAALAQATPGVLGARMMGGGFGGCVIALAPASSAASALACLKQAYGAEKGRAPEAFVCRAVGGAGELPS